MATRYGSDGSLLDGVSRKAALSARNVDIMVRRQQPSCDQEEKSGSPGKEKNVSLGGDWYHVPTTSVYRI